MNGGPDLEQAWAKLGAIDQPGTHLLALDARILLSASIKKPEGLLGLQIETDEPVEFEEKDLVSSEQVSVKHTVRPNGGVTLQLQLREVNFQEMFLQLCDDLVPRVLAQPTGRSAAVALLRRFNAWQRFLKGAREGLSKARQLGLFGELMTLDQLLLPALGHISGVASWTGPDNQPQDFQADRIALEVKTLVQSQPQQLRIDGERQLDDFGLDALVLVHHRIFQHQNSGELLPDLVERIRTRIAGDAALLEDLDDKLLAYGYADVHADRYKSTGYSVRDTKYYRVWKGFPRLIEPDLGPGVGRVVYSVDASACDTFSVEEQTVHAWLAAPPDPVDPAETEESATVEYKQTAWTPTGPVHNEEHEASVEKALRRSVLKSVVAFMNGDGGELVIGVEDSEGQVTGIEVDLEAKNLGPDNLDAYERLLVEMFRLEIGPSALRLIRFRFVKHDGGTACHVQVRPSPNPSFGYPPAKANEKQRPVFWVRTGNSTEEMQGEDLVKYVRGHW